MEKTLQKFPNLERRFSFLPTLSGLNKEDVYLTLRDSFCDLTYENVEGEALDVDLLNGITETERFQDILSSTKFIPNGKKLWDFFKKNDGLFD